MGAVTPLLFIASEKAHDSMETNTDKKVIFPLEYPLKMFMVTPYQWLEVKLDDTATSYF